MLDLRLLGEISIRASDGSEVEALLRQPKRLALLAYLASPSPGTWHRRDMLLALFWPDLDTAHARTALRNALYAIRQTLGDGVLRTRGDEEISIDPAVRTDLSIVWDSLRNGRVDDAIANYRGDFLPGLYPPDSQGFDRWVDSERTRLRVAVSTAAMETVEQVHSSGDYTRALTIARRVSEINPDDETIVRRVMTLHESVGDRAGGLAAFESYRARLQKDFDAEPAPETIDVVNRLRASSIPRISRKPRETSIAEVSAHPSIRATPENTSRPHYLFPVLIALTAVIAVTAWKVSREPEPQSIGVSKPLTSEEGLQIEAAMSPNGRLVAYAKGNANRLRIFVQRIDGGPAWPLSGDSSYIELMPRWSPDNDQILFLSRNNAYVSPTLGGSARIVAKGSEGDGVIRSASWSPTGDSIAIVRNDSLFVQPSQGHATRFIGSGFQLHSCVWSPDSKWIACVSGNWIAFTPGPLFGNEAPSAVLLFPVAGGQPVQLTPKDNESRSPSWSSDGRFLWVLSNRDGIPGEAFAIPIGGDGNSLGQWVREGISAEWISLSAGRIAYSVASKKANIWSVPIPARDSVSISSATRLTSGNQVIELVSASRDGKWLVYDSNLRGNSDIYRIPIAGGQAELLTDDARQEFAPDLSPDGQEIAWQRWVNGMRRLYVKRLDSDSAYQPLDIPGDQGVPRWSNDGQRIVAWSHNNERGAVFMIERLARDRWKQQWRIGYGQLPVWSPDNQRVAFVMLDGSVRSIPADSGEVTTLYAPRPGTDDPLATFLVWNRDADTLWMLAIQRGIQGIWSLSATTGRIQLRVKLDDLTGKSIGPALTADHSNFYFSLNERSSNMRWAALDNR